MPEPVVFEDGLAVIFAVLIVVGWVAARVWKRVKR